MKKFTHISIIVIFLIGMIGITVDSHYCGTTLVGTSMMGHFSYHNDKSAEMSCCSMHKHCKHCKTTSLFFKVQSSFMTGEQVLLYPQWTHNLLAEMTQLPIFLLQPSKRIFEYGPIVYRTPFYDHHLTKSRGFRAPPSAIVLATIS